MKYYKKDIDSFSVRFVAALKIVSKKYFNGNFNAPAILFAYIVTGKQIGRASCRERVLRLV